MNPSKQTSKPEDPLWTDDLSLIDSLLGVDDFSLLSTTAQPPQQQQQSLFRFDINDEEEERNLQETNRLLDQAAKLNVEEELRKDAAVRALEQSDFFAVENTEYCDSLVSDDQLQISSNGVSFSITKDLLSQWEMDMEKAHEMDK